MAGARPQSLRGRTDGSLARIMAALMERSTMPISFDAWDRFSVFRIPSRRASKEGTDRPESETHRPPNLARCSDSLATCKKATLQALLENVREKTDDRFLRKYVAETESFAELKQHYVDKGPDIKPIRPEYLAATLCELASDDAMFFADTGTAVMWLARHIKGGKNRGGSFRIVLLGLP